MDSRRPSEANRRGPDLSQSELGDLPLTSPRTTQPDIDRLPEASSSGFGIGRPLDAGAAPIMDAGRVLAQRFEIRRRIGAGGMGAVYEALDRERDEAVAIKVMRGELLSDEGARQRFVNEIKVATSLSHPHIVRVHDLHRDGNTTFFSMELLTGMSLRQRMQQRKRAGEPFPVAEVLHIARQLGEALSYAHRKTVHRDVKPENLWLDPDGNLKLMDFGIARVLEPGSAVLTMPGASIGTAYYMAPEQLKGQSVDPRADQYSAGVVLYELLTGELPQGAAEPPHVIRPDVPEGMSQAVMQAISQSPARRHADMTAFTAALTAAPSPAPAAPPSEQRPTVAAAAPRSPGTAHVANEKATADKGTRAKRAPALVLVSVLSLPALGIGYLAWSMLSPSGNPPGVAPDGNKPENLGNDTNPSNDPNRSPVSTQPVQEPNEHKPGTPQGTTSLGGGVAEPNRPDDAIRRAMSTHEQMSLGPTELQLRQMLADRQREAGPTDPTALQIQANLAENLRKQGRAEEALPIAREACDAGRRVLGEDSEPFLAAARGLSVILSDLGNFDESETWAREVLEKQRRAGRGDDSETLDTLHHLAFVVEQQGRLDQAEALYREEVTARERSFGREHYSTATAQESLDAVVSRKKQAEPPPAPPKIRLAVLDLQVDGRVDPTGGKSAAAIVREELTRDGRYDVLDRDMVKERLIEKDFALLDEVNQRERLVAHGKSLDVQKIVGGYMTSFGEGWVITLRLVDVNTGAVEATYSRTHRGEQLGLLQLAREGAGELLRGVHDQPPVSVAGDPPPKDDRTALQKRADRIRELIPLTQLTIEPLPASDQVRIRGPVLNDAEKKQVDTLLAQEVGILNEVKIDGEAVRRSVSRALEAKGAEGLLVKPSRKDGHPTLYVEFRPNAALPNEPSVEAIAARYVLDLGFVEIQATGPLHRGADDDGSAKTEFETDAVQARLKLNLAPFTTEAYSQIVPNQHDAGHMNWKRELEKAPVSLAALRTHGALEKSERGLSRLLGLLVDHQRDDRPTGPLANEFLANLPVQQYEVLLQIQSDLNRYGDIMVERGLLRP